MSAIRSLLPFPSDPNSQQNKDFTLPVVGYESSHEGAASLICGASIENPGTLKFLGTVEHTRAQEEEEEIAGTYEPEYHAPPYEDAVAAEPIEAVNHSPGNPTFPPTLGLGPVGAPSSRFSQVPEEGHALGEGQEPLEPQRQVLKNQSGDWRPAGDLLSVAIFFRDIGTEGSQDLVLSPM
ncbi:hypothetical protein P167DRAFT_549699 [Morchella conica CCBAS932]|uniref:Uncharacterized protein n=1 Tax=Morchella conica CCBAS932 TaxID=1392247 RepID=A0A3N4KAG4_9PEZI|nr:hypothetical protein P167DRAFT_549699 [Morchella conica CCBAS932]